MQTATSMVVSAPPNIQQPPRVVNDNAVHYGYCAFKDINLTTPTGQVNWTQPNNSPFFRNLPARQLIPFVNLNYPEVNADATAAVGLERTSETTFLKARSARECVEIMQSSGEDWGFKLLTPLIGRDDVAFQIFQTIQPFVYKLKTLRDEIEFEAVERIAQTETYTVEYEGDTVELEPLPKHLKSLAEQVRLIILESVEVAEKMAIETVEDTKQKMTAFFSTGNGKRSADPHDRWLFSEMGEKIPRLIDNDPTKPQQMVTTESPEMMDLRRRDIELRERELALKEAELAQRNNPTPNGVTVGQSVTVNGESATVTAKPFGRVKVQYTDGREETVDKEVVK